MTLSCPLSCLLDDNLFKFNYNPQLSCHPATTIGISPIGYGRDCSIDNNPSNDLNPVETSWDTVRVLARRCVAQGFGDLWLNQLQVAQHIRAHERNQYVTCENNIEDYWGPFILQ